LWCRRQAGATLPSVSSYAGTCALQLPAWRATPLSLSLSLSLPLSLSLSLPPALIPKMATDLRALSKARRCERSARPIDQGVRATNSVHATMSSSNSNLNTVYGSVQTVINSNPTYLLNGEIPEESVCPVGAIHLLCQITIIVAERNSNQDT